MSHQDEGVARDQAAGLQRAVEWLLKSTKWNALTFRQDCSWAAPELAAAALLWAWSDEPTLGERFSTARKIARRLFAPQQEFAGSVQAFLKLLVRWTALFVATLQATFRRRMLEAPAAEWLVHGFALFGVDGSRIELPRTKSNEAAYAPPRTKSGKKVNRDRRLKPNVPAHAKKATTPQLWLTLLWQVGTGLPWSWRIGPTGSSEREHWREMLPELPANSLIAADAGFVGYDYTRAALAVGHHVLIRVGSNVRLLRKLGWARESAGTVYLWPDHAASRRQPPLTLRLIVACGGKHPVYLVTSLPAARLSDRQVIDVYRRRWGIELYFRSLKQTFQRRKLRSNSAGHARVELEWSLLGLWAMGLYAQAELRKHGVEPSRLSAAAVLRAFRRTMRDYRHPAERGRTLEALLRRAVRDTYVRRNKTSRNYPRKKRPDPPPGSPQINTATVAQARLAREIRAAA